MSNQLRTTLDVAVHAVVAAVIVAAFTIDDDLPRFRRFTITGTAIGDDTRFPKEVKLIFLPNGEATIAKWWNGWTCAAVSNERATRDLYGAIFGTGST